ncbi:MAG: UbiA family prenyltransferase [Candidatus Kapaibacterium sp.]
MTDRGSTSTEKQLELTPVVPSRPLVVDLDFTVLATDITYESIILALKSDPLIAFRMPFWYAEGKVAFKNNLVRLGAIPEATNLPLNASVMEFILTQKQGGRRVILATASHETPARAVALHLGVFDDVIATSDGPNVGGDNKVTAIRALIGEEEFDYIGDRNADIPIWNASHEALAVNPTASLEKSFGRPFDKVFHEPRPSLRDFLRLIRVHQWLKNVLLFLPLILAHKVGDLSKIAECALAFAAFSLCASGVYVINDILDLESDRAHPRKRKRPFASGVIPVQTGLILTPALFLVSGLIASAISPAFFAALTLYVLFTSMYTLSLKRIPLVDVFVLAGLYAYRVWCGAIAVEVPISAWMLAFSMFMFLSLAFVKRSSELGTLRKSNGTETKGRGYSVHDADAVRSMGVTSGYMAVLVMALYINSADVRGLYLHPERLWFVVPLILYWISRVWLIAGRGEMRDDPVIFALEDRTSYVVAAGVAAVILLSTISW